MSDDNIKTDTSSSSEEEEEVGNDEYTRPRTESTDSNANLTEAEDELRACQEPDSPYYLAPLTNPAYEAGFQERILGCSVHPENENIVAVCAAAKLYLWNISTNVAIGVRPLESPIYNHGFSYDGQYIFTYEENKTISVFETNTMQVVWNSKEHKKLKFLEATWHPSRNKIIAISGKSDLSITVDFPACELKEFKFTRPGFCCCVFPDGERVLFGLSNMLSIYDVNTAELLNSFPDEDGRVDTVDIMTINHGGTIVAYAYRFYFLKVMSLSTGEIMAKIQYGIHHSLSYQVVMEFSKNDEFLAVGNGIGEVRIIFIPSFHEQAVYKNDYKIEIKAITWNDHRSLFALTYDGYVHMIYAITGRKFKTFHCHRDYVYELQFFKNRNKFLTCSNDGTIRVFEA